jgi:hypothetical protein
MTLSPSSKLRLEDEACSSSKKNIIEMLRRNPLAKITGDNLDVYIQAHTAKRFCYIPNKNILEKEFIKTLIMLGTSSQI